MTTETLSLAAPMVINGIGPYQIPHEYNEGSIQCWVVQNGSLSKILDTEFGTTPERSETSGNVYLTEAAAQKYDAASLYIERNTLVEQGWVGVNGSREKSLETQVDVLARAIQELQVSSQKSLRALPGQDDIAPFIEDPAARAGRVIIFDASGNPTIGVEADQISEAQRYSELARTGAQQASQYGGIEFDDVQTLNDDETLTYVADQISSVVAGQRIVVRDPGYSFRIAPIIVTDAHIVTEGGVKLYANAVGGTHLYLSQFGLQSDANYETGAGTDWKAKIDAWLAYVSANGLTGVLDGHYRYVGQLNIPTRTIIQTLGASESGFLTEIDDTMSGTCIEASHIYVIGSGWTLCRNLTVEKTGPDKGHLGNVLRLNSYINGAQPQPVQNIRLPQETVLRDVPGSHPSPALGGFGRVQNVRAGSIKVQGDMSLAVQFHWSGDITAIGQTVTESYHPHDIKIEELDLRDSSNVGLVLSACYNIEVGTLRGADLMRGIYVLAGDETDDFDVDSSGQIGKGLVIHNAYFDGTMSGESDFIRVLGHGASKFRTDAAGNALQKNLDLDVTIGNLVVHGSNNMNDCFVALNATGNVDIKRSHITGFNRYSAYIERSIANISFRNGKHEQEVRSLRSRNFSFEGVIEGETGAGTHGAYVLGEELSSTLAAGVSGGAVSITVSTGFTRDILRGDRLIVGDYVLIASEFVEAGVTTIPIEASEKTLSSGSAIKLDLKATNVHIGGEQRGQEVGVRANKAEITLSGAGPQDCELYGLNLTDSYVSVMSPRISGTGKVLGTNNYDVRADGASVVNIHGGMLGINPGILDESLYVLNTSKVNCWGTVFGDAAKASSVAAGAAANLTNCYDLSGASVA